MKSVTRVLIVLCVVGLLVTAGCGTSAKKPKPEELVMQQTQGLVADLLAGKADTILNYVSEDFSHPEIDGGKARLAEYIEQGKNMGYVEKFPEMVKEHNAKVVLDGAKVTVTKDTASIYPIQASANEGSVTVELQFKKEIGRASWRERVYVQV
jgi:hypothetical protein